MLGTRAALLLIGCDDAGDVSNPSQNGADTEQRNAGYYRVSTEEAIVAVPRKGSDECLYDGMSEQHRADIKVLVIFDCC